jgi:SpoVK/Ycf46/Vps4 family AAA+-type ATPase
MSQKKAWERHEDALMALEEARDIDTKKAAEGRGADYTGPVGKSSETDKKRLDLEASRTLSLKTLAGLATAACILFLLGSIAPDSMMGKGDVEIVRPDKNGKNLDHMGGLKNLKKVLGEVLKPEESVIVGGTKPVRSILMFGPPGCGKTQIAKAAANQYNFNYIEVTGGRIVSSYVGQSGQNIRRYFKMARSNAPCILFFDEVETILKKRGGGRGRTDEDDRTVSEFLTEMNAIFDAPERVIVIGATNLPESLDDAAVRRFHRRLYVPIPGKETRKAIITNQITQFASNTDLLDEMVKKTHGRSSSDLTSCINSYFVDAAKHYISEKGTKKKVDPKTLFIPKLIEQHLGNCKSTIRSSTLPAFRQWSDQFGEKADEEDTVEKGEHRELSAFDLDEEERKIAERSLTIPTIDQISFAKLSGLEYVKAKLLNAALMAVNLRDQMRKGIINPDKAFLLFGPPGTGKSVLAAALASEAFERTRNVLHEKPFYFLSFSAADIKGKYHGESEQNLARYFRVAEANQPCIMFIDEIDTLLINRNNLGGQDGGAALSVLGQFLQLMDGASVDPGRQVIVLAATNYPENVDSAALRRMVPLYVPLPGFKSRRNMFMKKIYLDFAKEMATDAKADAFFDKRLDEKSQISLENLATVSEGFSAADINRVIQLARTYSYDEWIAAEKVGTEYKGVIEPESIKKAFDETKPSASPKDVDRLRKLAGDVEAKTEEEGEEEGRRKRGVERKDESKETKVIQKNDRMSLFGQVSYWIFGTVSN